MAGAAEVAGTAGPWAAEAGAEVEPELGAGEVAVGPSLVVAAEPGNPAGQVVAGNRADP